MKRLLGSLLLRTRHPQETSCLNLARNVKPSTRRPENEYLATSKKAKAPKEDRTKLRSAHLAQAPSQAARRKSGTITKRTMMASRLDQHTTSIIQVHQGPWSCMTPQWMGWVLSIPKCSLDSICNMASNSQVRLRCKDIRYPCRLLGQCPAPPPFNLRRSRPSLYRSTRLSSKWHINTILQCRRRLRRK